MTNIDKIEHKLKEFNASYIIDGNSITALPCSRRGNGFSVNFLEQDTGFTVSYDGWHEEFTDEEDALAAFAFGLSEDCRLKVILRGSTECAWTVQELDDGNWIGDSTTALLFTPFWKKRRIEYRQNHFTELEH